MPVNKKSVFSQFDKHLPDRDNKPLIMSIWMQLTSLEAGGTA
jgi:hypothetical protein